MNRFLWMVLAAVVIVFAVAFVAFDFLEPAARVHLPEG